MIKADELIVGWRAGPFAEKRSLHIRGNYRHVMKRTPAGWRVTAVTFTKTYERGNAMVRAYVPLARK